MFLARNHSKIASDYPSGSAIRESDWHILAAFWHPVAFAREVADQPLKRTLLDVDLVLYRTCNGVTVAMDRCPHRGARLSDGIVEKDRIICPMHGLNYDHSGACIKIPSIADGAAPIPKKLCLSVCQSVERYGLIWTCLKDEAAWPMPEWPQLEDPERKCVTMPSGEFQKICRDLTTFGDTGKLSPIPQQSPRVGRTNAHTPPRARPSRPFSSKPVYAPLQARARARDSAREREQVRDNCRATAFHA